MSNFDRPVEAYYDKLAKVYDKFTSTPGAWTTPALMARELKELARQGKKFSSALVIGVGTGHDIEALQTIGVPHIEGLDISAKMLEHAALKFPHVGFHHADFMEHEKFLRSRYDLILCAGTLEFIPDFPGFFAKCARMLESGGTLIVTYEPIIINHKLQHEAQSEMPSDNTKKWGIKGLMSYRRGFSDFLRDSAGAGLRPENFFEFIAYNKLKTDVIYHFARLVKV